MTRFRDAALLLRMAPFGEGDAVVTFLTERHGKVATIARGARKSSKRFGGALEPIHGLRVDIEDRGKELMTLKEASVERPRVALANNLEALEAAGQALRWARALCPPRTAEPEAFDALTELLDRLDITVPVGPPLAALAVFGVRLLGATGFGLEVSRCVSCGTPCPEGRAASLDIARGGIVCSDCGGARLVLSSALRTLAAAVAAGEATTVSATDATALVRIVELALAAHGGVET